MDLIKGENKLAIVVPYYKISFFAETLSSLVHQTNKKFNVYVGDDYSPEVPLELIKSYAAEIGINYKRFPENLGGNSLTSQWKRCIELTKGEEWLLILGDDDYLSPNFVDEFYQHLSKVEELRINIIRFANKVISMEGKRISKLYTYPVIELASDTFYNRFLGSYRSSLSEHIFRREAYKKWGFRDFPLAWGADLMAWLDFSEYGYIYSINEANSFIRMTNQNISRSGYESELKNRVRIQYLKLVIEGHIGKFEKKKRLPLLLFYEQVVRKEQCLSLNFFLRILRLLLKEGYFLESLRFFRRNLFYKFSI